MMNRSIPRESEMLEKVRQWRREAYEAHGGQTDPERAVQLQQLADRFGLQQVKPASAAKER